MITPTPDQLSFILESGILAPSADNYHRLRFEFDSDTLEVWSAESSLPTAEGYKRALALLSLGAVGENLSIASSRYGIGAEPELLPDQSRSDLLFQIRWRIAAVQSDPLWEMIPRRHTNRAVVFRGPKLSCAEKIRLEAVATTKQGTSCHLVWLDKPLMRRQALKLIRLAESERFRNQLLHKEMFSAIRFDVGWDRSCETGLPPGSLGIERLLRPAFISLRHWPVMRVINVFGGYRLLGWRAADLPCRLAPHLGVLTVNKVTDGALFAAGRVLQRIWLEITRLGMALQPMPASALYALEGAQNEGIPYVLNLRLQRGWDLILHGKQPIILFRIGRSAPLAISTGRRSVASYTT
jgi:hypothetical protein